VCDTGLSPGRVVRELLARAGLLSLLEVQVFSNEVGVPKPHPRMFEAALGPLGVAAAHAVHVGDLRRTDVQGGRGYGMGTVRIRAVFDDGAPFPDADAVIDAHHDLADALEAIATRR
jgi:FMN phosphatase YigB (HAD superfamily)